MSRWAPSSENNTALYVSFVAQRVNVNPDAIINYDNEAVMIAIVRAMAKYECGQEIEEAVVRRGYQMA